MDEENELQLNISGVVLSLHLDVGLSVYKGIKGMGGGEGLKIGSIVVKERGVAEPPLTPHFKIRTTGFEE